MQMLRNLKNVSIASPNPIVAELDGLEKQARDKLKGFHRKLFIDALEDERRSRLTGISGWKHCAPQIDHSYAETETCVLFLVRDPYSWIVSLTRRPYNCRTPKIDKIDEFIERPWLTMRRDNIAPVLSSPIGLWNEKLRAYRAFSRAAPVPSTLLKFEDFVQAPVAALAGVLEQFEISHNGLAELEEPTKAGGMERAERQGYYAREGWKAKISPHTAALINANVDWDIARSFGYEMRDPESF